jgi:hypothetical protein
MRLLICGTMLLALLAPATAVAGSPAECARLQRQIDHFEGMRARAEELGNPMWEERMAQHVELLELRQLERCPEHVGDKSLEKFADAFGRFLKLAASAAVTYFTFGAF